VNSFIRSDSIRLNVTYVGSYDLHDESVGIGQQLLAEALGLLDTKVKDGEVDVDVK